MNDLLNSATLLEAEEVLILEFLMNVGESRTLDDIALQMGQSTIDAQYHCDRLWVKGLVEVTAQFTHPHPLFSTLNFAITRRGREEVALHLARVSPGNARPTSANFSSPRGAGGQQQTSVQLAGF
jgi:DNA-binding MarR family transcriptional regulator